MNTKYTAGSQLKEFLFLLSVFLLPFDSFPIFIGSSVYRPISIFPMLMYFVLLACDSLSKRQVKSNVIVIFTLYFLFLGLTIIKALQYEDRSGFIDFFLSGTLGVVAYSVFTDYFEKLRKKSISKTGFFNKVARIFLKAMIFPCFIGFIQIAQKVLHLNNSLFSKLYSIFTYRFESGRVFLVCGEPSWAVIYLLVLGFFLAFSTNIKYRNLLLLADGILIICTFSLLGLMSLFIAFVIYYFLCVIKKPAKIVYLIGIILLVFLMLFLIDNFIIGLISNQYLVIRYQSVRKLLFMITDLNQVSNYLQTGDSSLFVRLVNPLIGIMIGFNHPLIGVGGGYYYKFYGEYIEEYFPLAVRFPEVKNAVNNTYQITCRNFFCRFFAEFGLIAGIGIFLNFLLKINRVGKTDKRGVFLLALIFTVVVNFDSLCYLPFIFLTCIFNSYVKLSD